MESVQRNGGTAGIIAAICLAVLFILFASSGLGPQTALDPAKALSTIAQKSGQFTGIGIFAMLSSAFGLIFTFGLYVRLKDRAPTRAAAVLGFAFIGLTAHVIGSTILWLGGKGLTAAAAMDQTAANHAWIATWAVAGSMNNLGNAFTGATILIAGWAVIATGALPAALGWVGVITGIIEVLQVFASAQALMGLGFLGAIIWLAWGGSALRGAS